jgi:hypothetical protein
MDPLALEAVRLAAREVEGSEDERVAALGAAVGALAGALFDQEWEQLHELEKLVTYMNAVERRGRELLDRVERLTAQNLRLVQALQDYVPIDLEEEPDGGDETVAF